MHHTTSESFTSQVSITTAIIGTGGTRYVEKISALRHTYMWSIGAAYGQTSSVISAAPSNCANPIKQILVSCEGTLVRPGFTYDRQKMNPFGAENLPILTEDPGRFYPAPVLRRSYGSSHQYRNNRRDPSPLGPHSRHSPPFLPPFPFNNNNNTTNNNIQHNNKITITTRTTTYINKQQQQHTTIQWRNY